MAVEELVIIVFGVMTSLTLFGGSYWGLRVLTHKKNFTSKSEDRSEYIAFFGAVIITTIFVWLLFSL